MLGLMASLNILVADASAGKWFLPNKKLQIELVEWPVLEACLGRKEYLVEDFNCYEKSEDIYDQETCFAKGKIKYLFFAKKGFWASIY